MKRGTPRHPKTYKLAEALKVPHTQAVGILNMLWEHAGEQTPRGDIGALPNSAIAVACEWPPKKALQLVDALTASRWIDRHEKHRLIIHDWPHHCEYEVYRKLKKNDKNFLECYGDVPGRFPEDSGKSPGQIPASRKAKAKAEAKAEASGENQNSEIAEAAPWWAAGWNSFHDLWLKPCDCCEMQFPAKQVQLAESWWFSLVQSGRLTEANLPQVLAGLGRWRISKDWHKENGKFVHSMATWLGHSKDGRPAEPLWTDSPTPKGAYD